jgi:acetyl esterase/lipase
VIVCPGGAWHFLAVELEGTDIAHWLNERGIAAFVLKYRLIRTGSEFPTDAWANLNDPEKLDTLKKALHPLWLADGHQAVRLVRQRAAQWGLSPQQVGMMGFSAGGMVTANVALQYDTASRPDFAAVIYGAPCDEIPAPADATPLFLLCAADDAMASGVSLRLYSAWNAAGHSVEMHIFARGGHGFGLRQQGLPSDSWLERFADWLRKEC